MPMIVGTLHVQRSQVFSVCESLNSGQEPSSLFVVRWGSEICQVEYGQCEKEKRRLPFILWISLRLLPNATDFDPTYIPFKSFSSPHSTHSDPVKIYFQIFPNPLPYLGLGSHVSPTCNSLLSQKCVQISWCFHQRGAFPDTLIPKLFATSKAFICTSVGFIIL